MTLTARLMRRAITPQQIFGTGLDDWYAGNTAAGVQVTIESVMRAASGACIRLLTDDISSLPMDFFRRNPSGEAIPMDAPDWYLYPTPKRWDTWPHHISQVTVSLLTDGNAFIEGLPNAVNPENLIVLDPSRVTVEYEDGQVGYKIAAQSQMLGRAEPRTLYTDAEVMHIPWITLPGKLRGLSILEATKESTGLELAAREWAARFFSNGATLGGIIEVPREAGAMTKESAEALRDQFLNRHQGKRKAFALGVLSGGARWVQNTVSPEEAALQPLWRHVIEEAARLYHIPPHLLASQETGGQAYASVEHRSIEYVQHAIVPIVTRLEAAYSRLIPGEDTFVRFNVSALLRGDTKTRAEAYSIMLQNRIMRPEEARALEDLRPDPDLKGYLQTPNNTGPDPRIIDLGNLIEAGFTPQAALAYLGLPPIEHSGGTGEVVPPSDEELPPEATRSLAPVIEMPAPPPQVHVYMPEQRVEAPVISVNVPESRPQEAPVVNVTVPSPDIRVDAPIVNVTTPEIRVDLPDLTPIINVAPSTVQDVNIVGLPPMRAKVKRDVNGRISEVTDTNDNG